MMEQRFPGAAYDRWKTTEPVGRWDRRPHRCQGCGIRCYCPAETIEECPHSAACKAIVEEGA